MPLAIGLSNLRSEKSGGDVNCCIGVKGADDIDPELLWCPFVMTDGVVVPGSVLMTSEPEQQELVVGAGAGITTFCVDKEVLGPEQHDAVTAATGGGAGAAGAQQEGGASAGTLISTGSVVTCSPRATKSW